MHLADAFIQSDLQSIQAIHFSDICQLIRTIAYIPVHVDSSEDISKCVQTACDLWKSDWVKPFMSFTLVLCFVKAWNHIHVLNPSAHLNNDVCCNAEENTIHAETWLIHKLIPRQTLDRF